MAALGIMRGLSQCASALRTFTILALDHRQNLRRDLRPDAPGQVGPDELIDFKRAAVGALGDAATGVLLDPEYGAAQCISDGSLSGSTGLIVALEETGYAGASTDRRSRLLAGWSAEAARHMGAAAAKLLVYYNPAAPGATEQERLVEFAVEACHAVELPLFLEPLTFSLTQGERLTGEERRRAVVATARRLGGLGVDVVKIEFPYDDSVTDRAMWREACAELSAGLDVPWVLLSGGADASVFLEQVEIACLAGASGVAAGRAIWSEATRLAGAQREMFLGGEARRRLAALRELVERVARPWTEVRPLGGPRDTPPPDWFRTA